MFFLLTLLFTSICTDITIADTCAEEVQCTDCDRYGFCETDCYTGYYGNRCNLQCSSNCLNRTCIHLKDRGIEKCTGGCVPGYKGTRCMEEIPCHNPEEACSKCPTDCDGQLCRMTNSCAKGCKDSYYGTDCQSCSLNCELCDRMSGTCSQCKPNWGGPECQHPCNNCLRECAKTGCSDGCKRGYYGPFCTIRCSANCQEVSGTIIQTEGDVICGRNGTCLHGCKDGWYGSTCNIREETVTETRPQSDTCQKEVQCANCDRDGLCETDCYTGYYGKWCNLTCSPNCLNKTCIQLKDRGIGKCTDGCVPGYKGTRCMEVIPCHIPEEACSKCPTDCDGQLCRMTNSCAKGCKDSYYGTDCQSCSPNCELCDRMSGTCSQCKPNCGGPECQHPCTNCLGECAKTGCSDGCKRGYYGPFCTIRCSTNCQEVSGTIMQTEGDVICGRNGICLHGCKDGWYGSTCNIPEETGAINNNMFLGIGLALTILLCIITVLLMAHLCRRGRQKHERKNDDDETGEAKTDPMPCATSTSHYCEIVDSGIGTATSGPCTKPFDRTQTDVKRLFSYATEDGLKESAENDYKIDYLAPTAFE